MASAKRKRVDKLKALCLRRGGDAIETTAQLLSLISYPERPESQARFCKALQAQYWQKRAMSDGAWANSIQSIKPIYLLHDSKETSKVVNKGMKELWTRRFLAGDMLSVLIRRNFTDYVRREAAKKTKGEVSKSDSAVDLLLMNIEAQTWNWIKQTKSKKELNNRKYISLNLLAERIADDLNALPHTSGFGGQGGWSRDSVYKRIWRPSKTVAHLAMAVNEEWRKKGIKENLYFLDVMEGQWLEAAVKRGADILATIHRANDRAEDSDDRRLLISLDAFYEVELSD